jgi:inorganic pyrophosphatase
MTELKFISEKITEGADSFLQQEYMYLGIFAAAFAILLGCTVDMQEMGRESAENKFDPATNFPYTATAFLAGCFTSILAGYIGMKIAVYTNSRTTFGCCEDVHTGFLSAFRGGQVLGFVLVGLALLVLEIIIIVFKAAWFDGALKDLTTNYPDFT